MVPVCTLNQELDAKVPFQHNFIPSFAIVKDDKNQPLTINIHAAK